MPTNVLTVPGTDRVISFADDLVKIIDKDSEQH